LEEVSLDEQQQRQDPKLSIAEIKKSYLGHQNIAEVSVNLRKHVGEIEVSARNRPTSPTSPQLQPPPASAPPMSEEDQTLAIAVAAAAAAREHAAKKYGKGGSTNPKVPVNSATGNNKPIWVNPIYRSGQDAPSSSSPPAMDLKPPSTKVSDRAKSLSAAASTKPSGVASFGISGNRAKSPPTVSKLPASKSPVKRDRPASGSPLPDSMNGKPSSGSSLGSSKLNTKTYVHQTQNTTTTRAAVPTSTSAAAAAAAADDQSVYSIDSQASSTPEFLKKFKQMGLARPSSSSGAQQQGSGGKGANNNSLADDEKSILTIDSQSSTTPEFMKKFKEIGLTRYKE